ncbi:immunity 49 family protein [Kitasatospora sp. NA04385]|uniref:immunity 49 family protein n=1 Tax=Kitasatospora sp. NA04385 TaxID=2742135 RepID=UPI001592177C|nr:immunity 49 family protein [Kitasatospora sp. NA04385]QKW22461.1 immunity 49 family protein [Kitasatospora sp. NA04385]
MTAAETGVVTVERHLVPRADAQEFADELSGQVARLVDGLEESAELIDYTFKSALLAMRLHCLADPDAGRLETWTATTTALQVGSALFAATGADEGRVDCFIGHRARSIPALGPQPCANPDNWLDTLWLAVICRDRKRIEELCEVPPERLRAGGAGYDDFVHRWTDALRSYWLRGPDLIDRLGLAFEASHPQAVRIAPFELVDQVLFPPLDLLRRIVARQQAEFGRTLVAALEAHRTYWTSDESWATDANGALPLGPLAMACHAFDGDFPIGVESPYIPKYLLNREWLGEFPT